MRFKLNRFLIFIILIGLVTSCQNLGHNNFNKQKYLKGKLKPKKESTESIDVVTFEAIAFQSADDFRDPYILSELSQIEVDCLSFEFSESGNYVEEKPVIVDEFRIPSSFLPYRLSLEPSSILDKGKTYYHQARDDFGASMSWFLILLFIGLLSLILFVWIAWWAFVISGVFILASVIVLLTFDSGTPRGGLLGGVLWGILLAVILAAALALAIAALLIYLLVLLILLIFG